MAQSALWEKLVWEIKINIFGILLCFWHSLTQRFSVSVSEKKLESKLDGLKLGHASGGSSAIAPAGGLSSVSSSVSGIRESERRDHCPSVKKEPMDSLRERQSRYSPELSNNYQPRTSPPTHPPTHYPGYHMTDKPLLPPSLSGPHSSADMHNQKFDFYRPTNPESDSNRGLQSHGLC